MNISLQLNLCDKQWNVFDRSVNRTPKCFLLSTVLSFFSKKARRQSWVLNPFLKPHLYSNKNWTIKKVTCLQNNFSKIFEMGGG